MTPARPDLAAAHLRGVVAARRYAVGGRRRAAGGPTGTVPMRSRPDAAASLSTELLAGETITVYEVRDGWAWGQAETDGYVGYVPEADLGAEGPPPTHRVAALRAFIHPAPELKSPPLRSLGFGAPLAVAGWHRGGTNGDYAALEEGGWVSGRAIAPIAERAPDFVGTALRFLGVPYLWGGRSSLGLDCSALVQAVLHAAGLACPRDSDMQAEALGEPVPEAADLDRSLLRRGDLVFFPGHVGLMVDRATLLHANAGAMCVSLDPVAEVAARVAAASGRGVTAVRRLPATL